DVCSSDLEDAAGSSLPGGRFHRGQAVGPTAEGLPAFRKIAKPVKARAAGRKQNGVACLRLLPAPEGGLLETGTWLSQQAGGLEIRCQASRILAKEGHSASAAGGQGSHARPIAPLVLPSY